MRASHSQSGNIFFYIFLGIALFASLGYAVSRGGNAGSNISDEKARLIATELIAQSNNVKDAVAKLRLRGVKRTELSVANSYITGTTTGYSNANCITSNCKIFDLGGGGIDYPVVPIGATDRSGITWGFFRNIQTEDIDFPTPFDSSRDGIYMILVDVNQKVCRHINNLLHNVSLNIDLAGNSGFVPTGSPWDGVLSPGPGWLQKTSFAPLGQSKSAACIPYTGGAVLMGTFNYSSYLTLTGTRYAYFINLSPSR